MLEYRVYGGPGCGKTTYLSKQIEAAVDKYGQRVLICSFSNTAANELVTRGLPLHNKRIGTLHSFCRRAIGGGQEIAETTDILDEWNDKHGMTGRGKWHVPRSSYLNKGGDAPRSEVLTWHQFNILRNKMTPFEDWPRDVKLFTEAWTPWKKENDLLDFTDLIETVYTEGVGCPFPVAVLFADEAQDYSALEMSVVRYWGQMAEYFVLAGDDQQALYDFRGASAEVLLAPELPDAQVKILEQSYRLPSKILDYAMDYGDTMDRYQPKDIKPVREGGEVMRLSKRLKDPAVVTTAIAEADRGQTVMILASCEYMLNPVVKELREEGVLFHNPYRPGSTAWNPCRGGVERLRDFMRDRGEMCWRHVNHWFEHLDAKRCKMKRGAKAAVKASSEADDRNEAVTDEDFLEVTGFEMPPPDPEWFFERVLRPRLPLYDYARTVTRLSGMESFEACPKIIVGTFHSVKGGEADVVIMSSDVSRLGKVDYTKDPDPTRRMLYVGMTRAKERLILLEGQPPHIGLPYAHPYVPC